MFLFTLFFQLIVNTVCQSDFKFQKLVNLLHQQSSADVVIFELNYNLTSILEIKESILSRWQISFVKVEMDLQSVIEQSEKLDKNFSPMSILVLSQIQNISSLIEPTIQCPSCSWLFGHEDFIPSPVNTEFHLLDKIVCFDSEDLYEIYGIKGITVKKKLDDWKNGLYFPTRRRLNMTGFILDVVHVRMPTATTYSGTETLNTFREELKKSYERFAYAQDLTYQRFAYVQDLMGFTAKFHNTSSWVWAPPNATSMSSLIAVKQVDLALTNVALFRNDFEYRFLFPVTTETSFYIYYQSKHLARRGGIYEGILSLSVLLCLGGMIGLIILSSFSFYKDEKNIMWTIAILTAQGAEEPNSQNKISTRALTFVTLIFQLLCYTLISCFLVSKLSQTIELQTLQDLTERGLKFGIEGKTVVEDAINKSTPGSIFWDIRNIYTIYDDKVDAFRVVLKNEKFGLILATDVMEYAFKSGMCGKLKQLVIHGQTRYGSGFVHPKSEFSEPFNYAGILMTQSGVSQVHLRNEKRRKRDLRQQCLKKSKFETEIHFQDIKFTYYVLGFGILFGLVILILEKIGRKNYLLEHMR